MKPYYYYIDSNGLYNGGKISPEDLEAAIYYDTIEFIKNKNNNKNININKNNHS